jgi:protein-tyrosine phosphatase
MASWQRDGANTVVSLLTPEEERDLDLTREATEARAHGLHFASFPICDRQVPESQADFIRTLESLDRELAAGGNVVLHCRQGIGRTGLMAACLLVANGLDPDVAIERLSTARGIPVPETAQQRRWIERYAESLAAAR